MQKELEHRLSVLDGIKEKEKVDGILLWNSMNFRNPNFQWASNSGVDGLFYYDFSEPKIITSEMELKRLGDAWCSGHDFGKNFIESLKGKIAVDASQMPADIFRKINANVVDISEHLASARSIKTDWEVQQIRKAIEVAKTAYKKADKSGTEAEVRANLDYEMTRLGSEPSFPTIVAAGKNIEMPHHIPTGESVGDHLLIDWGAKWNGYCSDTTRTVGSKYQETLEKILEDTYQLIKPGVACAELHNFVVKQMGELSKHFIHSLGHGIGTAVHELPRIHGKSQDTLQPGMVFTIEPGLYLPGALRIENMFLMKENDWELLTDF